MSTVHVNRRNGHKATTSGGTWSCTCGASGEEPDNQYAQIAAQVHIRHPDRPVRIIH
jgi:hypothetical protein